MKRLLLVLAMFSMVALLSNTASADHWRYGGGYRGGYGYYGVPSYRHYSPGYHRGHYSAYRYPGYHRGHYSAYSYPGYHHGYRYGAYRAVPRSFYGPGFYRPRSGVFIGGPRLGVGIRF